MHTYDLYNSEGKLHAFEVENLRLGRHGVVRIVERIDNARITRVPVRWLSWFRESTFCEFDLDGAHFTVEEPFGDNSRYLIGVDPPGHVAQIELVHAAFQSASPSGAPSS